MPMSLICLQLNHDHNNMVDGNGKTPNVDVDGVKLVKKKKKDIKKDNLDNLKKEVEMVRKTLVLFDLVPMIFQEIFNTNES
jgi:hypothetical protein